MGTKFVATPPALDDATVDAAGRESLRKCAILAYFWKDPSLPSAIKPKRKSKWTPPGANTNPPPFQPRTTEAVHENISRRQRTALRFFKAHPELLVIPTDKNMGLAVIERAEYTRRIWTEMDMTPGVFVPFNIQPEQLLLNRQKQIRQVIDILNKLPKSKKTKDLIGAIQEGMPLAVDSMRLSQIRGLPKVHKQGDRMRIIVGFANHPLTPIHKFISKSIEPIMLKYNTVITQSLEIIHKLEGFPLDPEDSICTPDLSSMYFNISLHEAIDAIIAELGNEYLNYLNQTDWANILILAHQDIECCFDGQILRQAEGLTMGSNASPPMAVITLHHRLHQRPHLLKLFKYLVAYIDDGFAILPSNVDPGTVLNQLLEPLQGTSRLRWDPSTLDHRKIKDLCDKPLNFLDLSISCKINEGKAYLHFSVYTKPMGAYQYVPWRSGHPPAQKLSIIKGELSRRIRICSSPEAWQETVKDLKQKLINRGYKAEWIEEEAAKLSFDSRHDRLEKTVNKSMAKRQEAHWPWDPNRDTTPPELRKLTIPLIINYDPRILKDIRAYRDQLEERCQQILLRSNIDAPARVVIAFKNTRRLLATLASTNEQPELSTATSSKRPVSITCRQEHSS